MSRHSDQEEAEGESRTTSRRAFVKRSARIGLGVALLGSAGYTTLVEPRWLQICHYEIPIRDLPRWAEGLTILHATDSHHGAVVPFRYLFHSGQEDRSCSPCSCDGFDAYEAAQGGADYYDELGFTVTRAFPPGADHCDLPFAGVLGEQLAPGILDSR